MIQVPLGPHETKVMYNINNGPPIEFWVPGLNQNMRWAAYSVGPAMFLTHTFGELNIRNFCPAAPSRCSATGSLLVSIPMISADLVSSPVTTPSGPI